VTMTMKMKMTMATMNRTVRLGPLRLVLYEPMSRQGSGLHLGSRMGMRVTTSWISIWIYALVSRRVRIPLNPVPVRCCAAQSTPKL
jgi:hypothetical protein